MVDSYWVQGFAEYIDQTGINDLVVIHQLIQPGLDNKLLEAEIRGTKHVNRILARGKY